MADPVIPAEKQHCKTLSGRVLIQPSKASTRKEYECIFMRPGRVMRDDGTESDWLIPADVIKAAAPLFNSVSCFLDHPELFGFGWYQNPKVENLVGVTFNSRWSDEENALLGCIRLYDEQPGSPGSFVGALLDQMLADKEQGLELPQTGLSTVSFHTTRLDEQSGLTVTTEITHGESVDVVYSPGAGGYVRAALSAIGWNKDARAFALGAVPRTPQGGSIMPNEPTAPLGAGKDSQEAQPNSELSDTLTALDQRLEALSDQIAGALPVPAPNPDLPEPNEDDSTNRLDTLTDAVERLAGIIADQENPIKDMGAPQLRGGLTGLDQVTAATEAMLLGVRPPNNIQPLTGIRELYHLLSGDFEMTGMFNPDRVYLANVTSATMAKITADVLNKRVINAFQAYPRWWEKIISPEDFNSLQDVKWITLGGVGELPTVGEGQAYQEMSWDDIEQKDSFVKKGGYLGLTLEAIDKDNVAKLRTAPRALAQAAWLTLSKSISSIFTANSGVGPNIYYDDSNTRALFHATNGNLGSSALSWAAYKATNIAMKKQTEHNSDERLGALTAAYYVLVPIDLTALATQILASAGEPGTADNDINPYAEGNDRSALLRSARERVIEVPLWTNTANWATAANPQLYPSIGLGFRYGHTPEIFSVASPTAGLMFTNDTMPIKVRFFYATGPMDWRGLYKHNI